MSIKPQNSNNDLGFIPLRRGLYEHILSGLMKGRDLSVYIAILFLADFNTGIAFNVSAPFIANFLRMKVHFVQRSLRRLEAAGYIKRFRPRGGQPGYDVVIDKYLVKSVVWINAAKSLSINEIAYTVKQDCRLTVGRLSFDCRSGVVRLSSIKELRSIRLIKVNKKEGKTPRASKSFTPPTLEEVKKYQTDNPELLNVDPYKFWKGFSDSGWFDTQGKPVRNWKLKLRTWSNMDYERKGISKKERGSSAETKDNPRAKRKAGSKPGRSFKDQDSKIGSTVEV
jgi:hypothetical protein